MEPELDIIICTYNREELLKTCIQSFINQDATPYIWRVIVVNNYNFELSESIKSIISELEQHIIINESQPGLSIARNAGIEIATGEWIGLVDDDARVPVDFISKAFDIIHNGRFDCFGGHIRSWWKYGRPRWLPESFGSKPILRQDRGVIKEGYNWGSNIFIKKEALEKVGKFPTNIGMKGSKLGYAAENLVQIALREKDYIIGYDPAFEIDHVVLRKKLKLWWHIQSAYSEGRDGRDVFKDQYSFLGITKSFKNCFSRPIKSLLKFLTVKDHYWEHLFLDSGKPLALLFGKISALLK